MAVAIRQSRLHHAALAVLVALLPAQQSSAADAQTGPNAAAATAPRQLLWGDTHLHTSYSFDAFLNGNHSADPDVAYRFAKGEPVIHPYNRTRVQLDTPLDFLVVTDHAEFYGGIRDIYFDGLQGELSFLEQAFGWYAVRQIRRAIDAEEGPAFFADLLPKDTEPFEAAKNWVEANNASAPPGAEVSAKNAWQRLIDTAESHNAQGTFTTLYGWEWSTIPGGANLHRVVVSDASAEQARQFMPFASTDSPYPEDLWAWLQATEERTGARFLAIPHNSNISKGVMFAERTLRGEPLTASYAQTRARWEPVVEVTQIKGDSETHPTLSPEDPFADFENYPWYIQQTRTVEYLPTAADFVRPALKTGLKVKDALGVNPFQFGMIGSTDSHTGLSSAEEPNFWGKMAYDSVPERKQGKALAIGPTGWSMQAGGLAAVWAEDNSRRAIVDAFKRREVYATSGPRIRLQVEATTDNQRVPMGGELTAQANSPTFKVTAQMDPRSGALDRLQMIKGWLDASGQTQERIYNMAWAGDREPDSSGRLPALADAGRIVDLRTGRYDNGYGAPTLATQWVDPDYDPKTLAFYYVRVLEIPTPRHSQRDAIALGLAAAGDHPAVIQERAYSSPIWLQPVSD